jgi:NDP-sugar pyrophosphorylase family protein
MVVGIREPAIAPLGRLTTSPALATTDAIVLCGTHWRRHAFAPSVPRPLLPVAQVPLVARTLGVLADSAFTRASVCTNGALRQIEARLSAVSGGIAPSFCEDLTPRGPAGCVRDAALNSDAKAFLVIEGSALVTLDLPRLLEHHCASGAAVTIVVQPAAFDTPDARSDVPAGIYVFNRSVIDVIPTTGFYDIKESLLPRLHRAGESCGVYRSARWCPRVLDAQSYLTANQWMICEVARQPARHAPFDQWGAHPDNPDALVHPAAHVEDGALLLGPVIVGPGAEVLKDATIVGPASVGANCVVHGGALVSRSVLWERATVGRDALVDRSVLVDDVTIEAGAHVVEAVRAPRPRTSFWASRSASAPRKSRDRAAALANASAR